MFISEEEIHRWLNIIVRETHFKVKFILSTLLQRYSTFYANDNQGNRVSDNKVSFPFGIYSINSNQVENCFSFPSGMTMFFLEICHQSPEPLEKIGFDS